MSTKRLGRSGSMWLALLVALAGWASLATSASANTATKPYAATVTPGPVGGGQTLAFTLKVTNDANPQPLGSANLTVAVNHDPLVSAAFTALSTDPHPFLNGNPSSPRGDAALVGNVIRLRNLSLPPSAFITLSFTAQAPCAAGDYDWGIAAKQSNDFKGTGNDFSLEPPPASSLTTTVTGTCKLAFTTGPADAQIGVGITDSALDSTGSPVQVAVETQDGVVVSESAAPVQLAIGTVPPGGTSTLDGTTLVNAVNGVATFCDQLQNPGCSLPSIGSHGQGYTLAASSAGIDPATSNAFTVVDNGTVCKNPGQCQAQAKQQGTTGTLSVTAQPGDLVAVSVGVDTLSCTGYTITTQIVTFTSTANSVSTVTITIDAAYVTKSPAQYQICFSSSLQFIDRNGNVVPPGGSGLLADCSKRVGPPCTVSRVKDKAGNVILTMQAPAGDPRVGG